MADENLNKNQDGASGPAKTDPPKEQEQKGSSGPSGPAQDDKKKQLEDDIRQKEEHLEKVNKAIEEANDVLREKRKAAKQTQEPEKEDETPQIDMEDPSSKAWDKHIKQQVSPVQAELEKEREDIRKLALGEFLADKPALASTPEKLKEVMEVYDRIKTGSERVKESVLLDLQKAFAAVFHDRLIQVARTARVQDARQQQIFTDPAVDRGTTAYPEQRDQPPQMSDQDRQILAKWGMTPQQWWDMKKETDTKKAAST